MLRSLGTDYNDRESDTNNGPNQVVKRRSVHMIDSDYSEEYRQNRSRRKY